MTCSYRAASHHTRKYCRELIAHFQVTKTFPSMRHLEFKNTFRIILSSPISIQKHCFFVFQNSGFQRSSSEYASISVALVFQTIMRCYVCVILLFGLNRSTGSSFQLILSTSILFVKRRISKEVSANTVYKYLCTLMVNNLLELRFNVKTQFAIWYHNNSCLNLRCKYHTDVRLLLISLVLCKGQNWKHLCIGVQLRT